MYSAKEDWMKVSLEFFFVSVGQLFLCPFWAIYGTIRGFFSRSDEFLINAVNTCLFMAVGFASFLVLYGMLSSGAAVHFLFWIIFGLSFPANVLCQWLFIKFTRSDPYAYRKVTRVFSYFDRIQVGIAVMCMPSLYTVFFLSGLSFIQKLRS
jgi:hypothetical protein